MRNFIILLPLIFLCCKPNSRLLTDVISETSHQSAVIKYQVKEHEVSDMLKYLSSDELEGRATGTAGMEKAAVYLEEFLKRNDVAPYFASYRDTLSNFKGTAYNIVGYIEGSDPILKKEFVLISGHYDHIGLAKTAVNGDFINNGANDDASGTTAVAEMAKYFSVTKSNKRSVLFVFFVGEEKGLLGSKHLAKKLKEQNFNLYAQFNIEMIGVPMKRDYLAYISGFDKSNMASKINQYTGKSTIGFLRKEAELRLFYRSDNYSFYDVFDVPCHSVSTFDFDNFDYYHHVSDEFKMMDMIHMTSFIQEMLPAVTEMTRTASREIHMN
ncbi:M28 family peptidase [Flavobacterium frigoris]|nr:M28 family peptidase [Flavobacterium frigoris]